MDAAEIDRWLALELALKNAEAAIAAVWLAAATVGVRRKRLERLKTARGCILDIAEAVADDLAVARLAVEADSS